MHPTGFLFPSLFLAALSALVRADYLHTLQTSDQKHAFYIQKTITELDAPKRSSLTE